MAAHANIVIVVDVGVYSVVIFAIQRGTEESLNYYSEIISQVCCSATIHPTCWSTTIPPVLLEPSVKKVKLSYFGSECIIAVEGANLHFCNKLSIKDTELSGEVCSLSGSAFQIDVVDMSDSLQCLRQGSEVNLVLHNPFSGRSNLVSPTTVSVVSNIDCFGNLI